MVQAVENRTALGGVVEQADAASGDIVVRVDAAEPVDGYANLMAATRGESITLTLPPGEPPPAEGERIRCVARMVGPQRYVISADSIGTA